jgi:exodeoxyribonuclease VII large subunit
VSELVGGLRELLEEDVGRVQVCGEVSNLHRAGSGHAYFTLKDEGAQIRAALFRGAAARIPFDPEEGLEVLVVADVTIYPQRGDLQLIVRHLEPLGQGALQLAFEQLRARLEAEGLFDAAHKRPLPELPRRVGVVTSPSGAAVQDVIRVSGERFPSVPLLIAPTRVQGDGAEREVAAALAALRRVPDVDVVLIVRGGGSLEDLQAFNTEWLARAIRADGPPIVSGVGHEVDVTICDLAADERAATPSAAAMLALPERGQWLAGFVSLEEQLATAMAARLDRARIELRGARRALDLAAPSARLAARRERADALAARLARAGAALTATAGRRVEAAGEGLSRGAGRILPDRIRRSDRAREGLARGIADAAAAPRRRLAGAVAQLDALSPLGVLARGFAIARDAEGAILRRASAVAPGDALHVTLADGEIDARVEGVRPGTAASGPDEGSGDAAGRGR